MTPLQIAYLHHRWLGLSPAHAIATARKNATLDKNKYFRPYDRSKPTPQTERGHFYLENPSGMLRLVGTADEVAKAEGSWHLIEHTGWYMDEFQDETCRGVVYRLPARKGESLFVPGFTTSYNDDGATLDFRLIFDDALDCARYADELARVYAKREREYQAAASARSRFDELTDDIADLRTIIATCSELRKWRRMNAAAVADSPVCTLLRENVRDWLDTIAEHRKARADLADDFDQTEG